MRLNELDLTLGSEETQRKIYGYNRDFCRPASDILKEKYNVDIKLVLRDYSNENDENDKWRNQSRSLLLGSLADIFERSFFY